MRTAIRDIVDAITPFDSIELEHKRDVLAWIDSGAPLCRTAKPATPPKHLVSYFVVASSDAVLLGLHRNAGLWLPNGGHVEPGENPRDTVVRESREELDIEAEFAFPLPLMITVTETVGVTAGHIDVSLWYALRGDRDKPLTFDATEFEAMKWFDFNNLPLQQTDPQLGRYVAKLKKLL